MRSDISSLIDERHLPWLGAIFGGLLASWVIFQNGGINNDGILYLEAAKKFSDGNWGQGFEAYGWPLYSLLIALVHKATGIWLQGAAHALTVVFFALSSAGMLMLVREVGGDRRTMFAAALLWFFSPYLVGTVLPMVVRDHGFWAAHLWSIVFFIRFYRGGTFAHALAWGGAALVAMLFRIEALTYFVLLPMLLLIRGGLDWRQRLVLWSKAEALAGLLLLGVIAIMAIKPDLTTESLGRLGEPLEVALSIYEQLSGGLALKAAHYGTDILGPLLAGYAMPGLVLTLISVILVKSASSAGWLQLALAGYAGKRAGKALPQHGRLLAWLVLLGLLNAVAIILSVFLLPKRYVLPIGFILIVYAAFGLVALYDRYGPVSWKLRHPAWMLPAALLLLFVQGLDAVWTSAPKISIEQKAGHWIQQNAGAGSRVFYSTPRLRYYATGETLRSGGYNQARWPEIVQLVSSQQVRQYDFLLIRSSNKQPEQQRYLNERLGSVPVAILDNGRSDNVLIYRVGDKN